MCRRTLQIYADAQTDLADVQTTTNFADVQRDLTEVPPEFANMQGGDLNDLHLYLYLFGPFSSPFILHHPKLAPIDLLV